MDVDIVPMRELIGNVLADAGSLAVKFSTVWSEKTTPQPKVTPGELRSNISTSCGDREASSRSRNKARRPAAMQAIFTPIANPRRG